MTPRTETFGERIARFLRSSAVGIFATIIDYTVLELVARVLHVDPSLAKIPALACGTLTQFVGSRYFAFRAQRGPLGRQLKWFVFAEFCAFCLTVLVFRVMVSWWHMPMEIANMVSGFLVYFGFSYPIWKRVFTVDAPKTESAEQIPQTATADRAA